MLNTTAPSARPSAPATPMAAHGPNPCGPIQAIRPATHAATAASSP
ncbi:MAG TPA: hypothetical protein VMU93_01745 [Caulobacteraceae bacterium]|nr:hypothetical protein [Caulobacteraceae bacterium]